MSKSKKSEKTQVRLDRFLADAGAGTRSEVKKMIQKGRVLVNDQPASWPGNRRSARIWTEFCWMERSRRKHRISYITF